MDSTATNQTQRNRSPKRVRTDSQPPTRAETSNSSQQTHRRSPTKAAEDALEHAVESLPPSLHKVILHYGRQIIEVRSKLHNKKQIASKMGTDDTYIPRSAKASDFTITLSKAATEDDTEKIDFLQSQVDQAKRLYPTTLDPTTPDLTR